MRKFFAAQVVAPESSFSTILKEGALLPDVYDPTVNPLFRDVHANYGERWYVSCFQHGQTI